MGKKKTSLLEKLSYRATHWIGTTQSLIVHTLFFTATLATTPFLGLANMLLILTTVVSLEAIYMSIFIQMSINRHGEKLKSVEADIDDIQEDLEDITDDFPILTDEKK